jgi:hypothetical protein
MVTTSAAAVIIRIGVGFHPAFHLDGSVCGPAVVAQDDPT